MNFFKRSFTRSSLSPTVPQLRGRNAYVCTDVACQAVMERAPRGVCERCGQTCIVSVQGLVQIARMIREVKKQQKEKPGSGSRQAGQEEEGNMNLSYFLTNCKK